MLRVGIISDTHGLLRREAVAFLRGCDHIVHGGDIGAAGVLGELAGLAPVTAIRGNNDRGAWAEALHETARFKVGEVSGYVIHDVGQLDIEPHRAGIHVVVYGHSHQPHVAWREGVLFINPGSAGPRRFKLPVAAAELVITGTAYWARIVNLQAESPA